MSTFSSTIVLGIFSGLTFNLLFFNQAVLFQNFFSNWLVNKPTKNTCDQNKPVLVFQIEPKSSVLQAWESICYLDVGEFPSTPHSVWNPASIPFHHPLRTYVFLYQQYVALWKHIVFHLCPFLQEDRIVVSSWPLGRPRFLMRGGTFIPAPEDQIYEHNTHNNICSYNILYNVMYVHVLAQN